MLADSSADQASADAVLPRWRLGGVGPLEPYSDYGVASQSRTKLSLAPKRSWTDRSEVGQEARQRAV